jgi:coenzyme F420-0:L-glutamate ligase / coenzyme F420-1:gamma-L-glutamate ligase
VARGTCTGLKPPARPGLKPPARPHSLPPVPLDALVVRALSPLPDVRPGDDLVPLLAGAAPADLANGDVLVVAHKVVSKAEGRVRSLDEIAPGERARALAAEHGKDSRHVQAVLDESVEVLRARDGVLVCETRHGLVCANAGIDQSNASRPGELVLLPDDPDASARRLREGLWSARDRRPALVVADSFGRPWRLGQTDVAIGVAGLAPLDEWIGRPDAYGRELRATSIAVADAVAAAADLARTKDSRQPAVLIRGLERYVTPEDGPGASALRRPRERDLFR